ncbi:TIR domain-containing protein [Geodermatophilus sp. SYSU D00742]
MRIAVFGSSQSRPGNVVGRPVPDAAALQHFCRRLGGELARGSSSVLVESDSPRSADRHVVTGMLDAAPPDEARIRVFHRAERHDQEPYPVERARYGGLFRLVPLREGVLTSTHLQMLEAADAAIVVGGGKNAYTAGRIAARLGVRLIPVPTFRGAGERLWQELRDPVHQPAARLPAPENWSRLTGTEAEVLAAIAAEAAAFPRLMLVHGRSQDRFGVRSILEAVGAQAPIVLRDRLGSGSTIPEKFEREARQADAAVVLFTPDEEVAAVLDPDGHALGPDDVRARARARQNVAVEFGWFWGRLGLDHVLLLVQAGVELPSDLAGLEYVSYRESPDERLESIRAFVESVRRR